MAALAALSPFYIFGATRPFEPPAWQTKDDRVRGGASQSYLVNYPETNSSCFHGHLDTDTLGGAGFASQFSAVDAPPATSDGYWWDMSAYDGIAIQLGPESDAKNYTLILKDEVEQDKRSDGREQAGISFEVAFDRSQGRTRNDQGNDNVQELFFPWTSFEATYRGKKKENAEPLKTDRIRRIGIMMRSYFGKQEGEFSLTLHAIAAAKLSSPTTSWGLQYLLRPLKSLSLWPLSIT